MAIFFFVFQPYEISLKQHGKASDKSCACGLIRGYEFSDTYHENIPRIGGRWGDGREVRCRPGHPHPDRCDESVGRLAQLLDGDVDEGLEHAPTLHQLRYTLAPVGGRGEE